MKDNLIMAQLSAGKPVLKIDLNIIKQNYLALADITGSVSKLGASVKADSYGLGMCQIAHKLANSGCMDFFVASLDEGIRLRVAMRQNNFHYSKTNIYVLNGVFKNSEAELVEHQLQPVINNLYQLSIWRDYCKKLSQSNNMEMNNDYVASQCALHVNTGMNRLGMAEYEYMEIIKDPSLLDYVYIKLFMSHLSSSDEPASPANKEQLEKFKYLAGYNVTSKDNKLTLPDKLKNTQKSFSNSGGIFLGEDYHFDLARPGAALYGLNCHPDSAKHIVSPVTLYAPLIHVQKISKGEKIGYGGSFVAEQDMRIATLPLGYADGYMRALSSKSTVSINGQKARVLGRVSMDLISIDVTNIDPAYSSIGCFAEVIGPNQTPDNLAKLAGTIDYEIITSLGQRYERVYTDDGVDR